MFQALTIKKFVLGIGLVAMCSGLQAASVSAGEPSGVVPVPTIKPKVNQLGTMEEVTDPGRAALVATLFLQVIACVFVALALAGHLSLPGKK